MERIPKLKISVESAVAHFKTAANLARALGISPQAITSWGEYVPELRAYKLREMFPDVFGSRDKAA